MDDIDGKGTVSRLAHLKAIKVYEEMRAEGLSREDLPRKLKEIAEREEAAVARLSAEFGIEPIDTRLLLQLAVAEEDVAMVGCDMLARSGSMMQAIAVMTVLDGELYEISGEVGPN